jgi:hypothetical protein
VFTTDLEFNDQQRHSNGKNAVSERLDAMFG